MTSTAQPETDPRKLLFISYAYEDQVFAKWLARKLAFYGYGVWFDQIKILGGESWVKEVDVAIKERSFRVLGLLSKDSIGKDNPRKERTLALQLAKQRKTDDFLITLNLDGVQPDWTLSDISWISFRESWADGLRRLLKKLESLNAPRIHAGNSAIAKAALERGASLIVQRPEPLTTNLLPFVEVPEALRVFDTSKMDEEQEKSSRDLWPHHGLEPGRAAAFSPPPPELEKVVKATKAVFHWPSFDSIHETPTHNIISRLLNRSVHAWLIRAGCILAEDDHAYYLPAPFRGESIYRFKDVDGSSSYIRVAGSIRLYRPNAAPEEVIHHPSIRYAVRKTDWGIPTCNLMTYNTTPFEAERAAVSSGGRTFAAGSHAERDFLDWTLRRALKHCATIRVYDRLFGERFRGNYECSAKAFIQWLETFVEEPSRVAIHIHCGLPGGSTDHFMQNQLSTFRRGRLAGMPVRIQFYKAADKFRDTGEHEALPHQRYLITDQFAFDLGRGMDFLDPNTLKNRDGKFGFAHPTELANALQSIPVPSLPSVSV